MKSKSKQTPQPDPTAPLTYSVLQAVASGTAVESCDTVRLDYSNVSDGYVMAEKLVSTDKKYKARIEGPTCTYTFTLNEAGWTVMPLSDGNGRYVITLFENVEGSKYASLFAVEADVSLKDEFAPFLRPNQYVNYEAAPNTVNKGAELTRGMIAVNDKVIAVYDYITDNITYDTDLAETAESSYLPDLDSVLAAGKGICFDYAALMTAMLRSQGVPCKLVIGYAGTAYHAWISVYSEEEGWVDKIKFDGKTWTRMDPTFAAGKANERSIAQYVGNGSNYAEKYFY